MSRGAVVVTATCLGLAGAGVAGAVMLFAPAGAPETAGPAEHTAASDGFRCTGGRRSCRAGGTRRPRIEVNAALSGRAPGGRAPRCRPRSRRIRRRVDDDQNRQTRTTPDRTKDRTVDDKTADEPVIPRRDRDGAVTTRTVAATHHRTTTTGTGTAAGTGHGRRRVRRLGRRLERRLGRRARRLASLTSG